MERKPSPESSDDGKPSAGGRKSVPRAPVSSLFSEGVGAKSTEPSVKPEQSLAAMLSERKQLNREEKPVPLAPEASADITPTSGPEHGDALTAARQEIEALQWSQRQQQEAARHKEEEDEEEGDSDGASSQPKGAAAESAATPEVSGAIPVDLSREQEPTELPLHTSEALPPTVMEQQTVEGAEEQLALEQSAEEPMVEEFVPPALVPERQPERPSASDQEDKPAPPPVAPPFNWHNTLPTNPNVPQPVAPLAAQKIPRQRTRQQYNVLPTTPNIAPIPTLNHNTLPPPVNPNTVALNERRAENRGLATGLIAGGLFVYFKNRRKQKKMRKELAKQGKELNQVRREQTELERKLSQYKESAKGVASSMTDRLSQLTNRQERLQKDSSEQRNELEQLLAQQKEATERLTHHVQPAIPEQAPQFDDRRVESSSWHRIEIDKRTGRPLEQPSLEYGEEYDQERSRERGASPYQEPDSKGAIPATHLLSQHTDVSPGAMPYPAITPGASQGGSYDSHASTSGADQNGHSQPQQSYRDPDEEASPWMWLVLAVVVASIIGALSM